MSCTYLGLFHLDKHYDHLECQGGKRQRSIFCNLQYQLHPHNTQQRMRYIPPDRSTWPLSQRRNLHMLMLQVLAIPAQQHMEDTVLQILQRIGIYL